MIRDRGNADTPTKSEWTERSGQLHRVKSRREWPSGVQEADIGGEKTEKPWQMSLLGQQDEDWELTTDFQQQGAIW